MAVEEQFYLLYPLLLSRMVTLPRLKRLLACVLAFGFLSKWVGMCIWPENHALALNSSFWGFALISLGALLYLYTKERTPVPRLLSIPTLFVVLGGAGLASLCLGYLDNLPTAIFDLLLCVSVSLTFVGLLRSAWTEHGVALWVAEAGKLSYGLYLWHIAALYFISPYLKGLSWSVAFPAYLAVTFCWGLASYHLYEWPLNQAIRKYFHSRSQS